MSQEILSKISEDISYIVTKTSGHIYNEKDETEGYEIEGYEIETIIKYLGNISKSAIFINKDNEIFSYHNGELFYEKTDKEVRVTLSNYTKDGIELEDDYKNRTTTIYVKLSAEVIEEIRDYVLPTVRGF